MNELIKRCLDSDNIKHDPKDDFDDTKVYSVESDDKKLLFWNSNNRSKFDHDYALADIMLKLLSDEVEGTVSEPYAGVEVMWEVK